MKSYPLLLLLFWCLILVNFSCKKTFIDRQQDSQIYSDIFSNASSSTCVEDAELGTRMDTILKPTILGYRLSNLPYSLTPMR